MKERKTVIKPSLEEAFKNGWKDFRIIFISAPCGCGKTTAAKEMLRRNSISYYEADVKKADFLESMPERCVTVLADDIQECSVDFSDRLCNAVRYYPDIHFILLSRGSVPSWLMPFKLTGLLCTITMEDLLLDQKSSQAMLASMGITVSSTEMYNIQKDFNGYTAALTILAGYMQNGCRYSDAVLENVKKELFKYYDAMVFFRFSDDMRSFLRNVAPFESFNVEFARIVSGDSSAGHLVEILVNDTTMLEAVDRDNYRFRPIFSEYLRFRMQYDLSEESIRELYSRAALYYELQDNVADALKCYSEAADTHRISLLLIKNAGMHPGAGHYLEMEKYYYLLPREEILKSPSLMCAMSMLSAMCMNYEESEQWYSELQKYASRIGKNDSEYREIRNRTVYLDIALPQRGVRGMKDILAGAFKMMCSGDIDIPDVSVTSMLPSIMNGGKDFCEWSKVDELLYLTMRIPVEGVLGKNGVGLGDCGLCESRFEKGLDSSKRMLSLMSRIGEIQTKGTPDIEFAVMGLLARMQIADGKAENAHEMITDLRRKYSESGDRRFLGNMDALLCRIDLLMGENERAENWLHHDAPRDDIRVWVLWRYQYITKAIVHISEGNNELALLDVARLLPYCRQCARIMDTIYIYEIMAICHYRMKDGSWEEELDKVLDLCLEYKFVYPVGQYGAAMQPLLNETEWNKDNKFLQTLRNAAKRHAARYPKFLKISEPMTEKLSAAEMQVLKLICEDMSNNDICDILGIKLPTVKTHVSHILQKLGIKRRSEAKARAEKLKLF